MEYLELADLAKRKTEHEMGPEPRHRPGYGALVAAFVTSLYTGGVLQFFMYSNIEQAITILATLNGLAMYVWLRIENQRWWKAYERQFERVADDHAPTCTHHGVPQSWGRKKSGGLGYRCLACERD